MYYKSWIAHADKYQPDSYPFKDRTNSGLWEHVITMRGMLIAIEKDRIKERYSRFHLSAGKFAEFPPDSIRSWELPSNQEEARGSTVLWSGKGVRTDEGLGGFLHGFCFKSWAWATASDRLHRTFAQLRLKVEYVEVFIGSLRCHYRGNTKQLQPGDFVYVKAGTRMRFEPEGQESRGTVLYY